jgi:hypothetical protein
MVVKYVLRDALNKASASLKIRLLNVFALCIYDLGVTQDKRNRRITESLHNA